MCPYPCPSYAPDIWEKEGSLLSKDHKKDENLGDDDSFHYTK